MTMRATTKRYVNTRAALAALIVAGVFGVGVIVGHVARSAPLQGSAGSAAPAAPVAVVAAPNLASAPETDVYVDYRRIVADLTAATDRHDARANAEYRAELRTLLTPAAIEAIHQEYARLLANLQTANNRHETHPAVEFRQQLSGLCGPSNTRVYLGFCGNP